ncbi:hypothetical protein OAory_01074770 [Aspergillus oryzae]|nr:hypothetical protein OAory_01074770 [Aspergillus oryzae]
MVYCSSTSKYPTNSPKEVSFHPVFPLMSWPSFGTRCIEACVRRDGVFHLEARIANSSMEFTTKDNVLDLTERCVLAKEKPSVWLIEVDPRPPGIEVSDALKHTYGIDYWGVGLLSGLQDRQRVRQLSHTFLQGPQYWKRVIDEMDPKDLKG